LCQGTCRAKDASQLAVSDITQVPLFGLLPPIGARRQKIALMKIVCRFVSELSLDSICQNMTDSTTAKVVVARIRYPAADESTVTSQSKDTCGGLQLEISPSDIRTSVDKSNKPTVADLVWVALCLALTNAEFLE
jgi:hypothetical protein